MYSNRRKAFNGGVTFTRRLWLWSVLHGSSCLQTCQHIQNTDTPEEEGTSRWQRSGVYSRYINFPLFVRRAPPRQHVVFVSHTDRQQRDGVRTACVCLGGSSMAQVPDSTPPQPPWRPEKLIGSIWLSEKRECPPPLPAPHPTLALLSSLWSSPLLWLLLPLAHTWRKAVWL